MAFRISTISRASSVTPQAVVVDTNIVSYLYRADPLAEPFKLALESRRRLISFQTLAELLVWAEPWAEAKQIKLERWVLARFGVLPHTPVVTRAWVIAMTSARRNGFPISPSDAWVAASAMSAGLMLLSADQNDFRGVNHLKLFVPPSA
jgi:predicted nucleic acid-binding protein